MRTLSCLVGLIVLTLLVAFFVQVSRLGHTCVICRLTRVDSTCLGITRYAYYPNECSEWYTAHVEPVHNHVWERGTCRSNRNLMGMPVSFGCSPGRFPIHRLLSSTQMAVYQHFRDPLEAKKLFESLTDEKTRDDRLDDDDEDRGHLMVRALADWESQGFPGTWKEWWSQYYAKHVEEHQEWLAWTRADSGLSFWDWQKQRKATAEDRPEGK